MSIGTTKLGQLEISRFILGGNPFSTFSHQSPERDLEMKRYYTTARIKEAMRKAEGLGVKTLISRADHHIQRLLFEYWQDGGEIAWIAQTCPELGETSHGVRNAIVGGAKACYVHGGQMDFFFAQQKFDEVYAAIEQIRGAGMPAGIAGHNPRVFEWAEAHLDVDFYMCSYYNPTPRDEHAEHIAGMAERFDPADRDAMVQVIHGLSKPVIHYKVLAAGRTPPAEALAFAAQQMRPQDAVCVGVFLKDNPGMIEEDLRILEECLRS